MENGKVSLDITIKNNQGSMSHINTDGLCVCALNIKQYSFIMNVNLVD